MRKKPARPAAKVAAHGVADQTESAARSVANALSKIPVPENASRARTLYEVHAAVEAQKAQLHELMLKGVTFSKIYRSLKAGLEKDGFRPMSYNTLKSWLSPLPR